MKASKIRGFFMRHICRTDIISDLNVNIKSNNLTLTQ